MATEELKIKNKYTGEIINTIPADTKETLNNKIKQIHRNQDKLKDLDFFERSKILGKSPLDYVLKRRI